MKMRVFLGMLAMCFVMGAYAESDPTSFVRKRYPNARILDKDYDDGFIEVKMNHRGAEKIVIFNHDGDWLRTMWEVRRNRLPRAVINVLKRSGFVYEEIDDNDNKAMENRRGMYYIVQADRNDRSYVLVVSEKGNIIERFYDDEWDDEWDEGRWEGEFWDDGEDHFDEGDDEWDDRRYRPRHHRDHRHHGCCGHDDEDEDDGEDHFDEGDDEWDDGEA